MPGASPLDGILYRIVARNLPGGGVWLFDADLRCLVAEGPLAEEWRRRIGPTEGREATQLFDREALAIVMPRLERALLGEAASDETDFGVRSFWTHYAPLPRAAGDARVMLLALDLTERRRTEEDLRQRMAAAAAAADRSRAQLAAVFDSIGEGISVFDAAGRVVLVNRAQARINGYPDPAQMLREIDYYADIYELTLPSGQPLPVSEWPVSRVLRGESIVDVELRGRRRDTGRGWFFSFSGEPVRGEDGSLLLAVVVTRDITERKRSEEARQESERRLRLAVSIAQLGFWEWDVERGDIFFSAQWKRQIGYDEDELPDRVSEWEQRLHPDDRERVLEKLALYLGHPEGDYRIEFRLRHRDGSYRWIAAQAMAQKNITGQVTRIIGTHLDVSELKLAEQRVREAAQHDALTGLPNRALVFEYADLLFAAARRSHAGSAVLFIDLDRFKPVNDLYGHEVGDRVLREVALRLKASVRHEDLVGRFGGDEFVVVLPHIGGGARRAATVASHVIDGICRPFEIGELSLSLSPSIGIAHFPEHGENADALIRAADLAMYQAKHAGRANYQFYRPQLDQHADESARIEATLRRALDGEGFALHYQPVVDMESGAMVGAEALLRLEGERGPISPERFIPIAESAGLIGPLGEWVAIEACRQHGSWLAAGLPPVTIAINVSPLQFRQRAFADRLRAIIASAGVAPEYLQVEVTESAVMDSVDEAVRILDRIKRYGIKVALDDFGTGYSSLSRLGVLPLDKLKVDQSFVKGVESERTSRAIIDAIIALGRTLNLEVVGEGIESEDAMRYLRARHCDQAQGYLISRPLPAAEFAAWLRRLQAAQPA